MSAETIAWMIIFGAAAVGATALYFLFRSIDNLLIKKIIIGLSLAFFLTPAPIPQHPEGWAPAFVVCIFEAFFQIDGSPGVSLRLLLLGCAVISAVVIGAHFFSARRRSVEPAEGVEQAH